MRPRQVYTVRVHGPQSDVLVPDKRSMYHLVSDGSVLSTFILLSFSLNMSRNFRGEVLGQLLGLVWCRHES